jgi:hypothetical protein
MRRILSGRLLKLSGVLLGLLQVSALLYGQDDERRYRFSLDAGNRWSSSFSGSRDLYRSHLDYGEGPRLFAGNFEVSAPRGTNSWFDRFQLRLNDWGGEPHTAAHLRMEKSRLYDVRFDYRNVQYYSSVPRFANPFFEQGNLQSQHVFDVGQRFSHLVFSVFPGTTISPYVAFDRHDRHGPVRTTLAAAGDEFVIGSLWDTYSNDIRGGVNVALPTFSLLLEQGYRQYREKTNLFTSGFQPGNSLRPIFGRDVVLNDYQADNDTTANIPFSNAAAVWRPHDSLSLRGNAAYSMANLNPHYSDVLAGNFFSFPLQAFFQGQRQQIFSQVKKPSFFGDFSAEWEVFDRFRLVENIKTHNFHVSSSSLSDFVYLQFEPVLEQGIREQFGQQIQQDQFLSFDNLTQQLQGLFYVTPRLIARLGHRYERREMRLQDRFEFSRNVLLAGLSYDFTAGNRVSAEYEYGNTNRPIMRTDIVDFQRARLRGRFTPFAALQFEGSATLFDTETDDVPQIDFTSRNRDYALQLNYTPARRFSFSGGWERSSIRTNILYIVPQTFTLDRSRYREKGNFGNAYLNVLLIRNASLSLGYSVWGVSGSFPLNYHRPMARLEVPVHERISFYGHWNYYDYNEKVAFLPQDYRTHLTVVGFRVAMDRRP